MRDPAELLPDLLDLAQKAGLAILEVYASDFSVQDKADDSPLTRADMASHHLLVAGLRHLTADCPILSEESAVIPFAERTSWSRYWLIDPLDGTKEFIKRNGEFTVNVALIDNHQPILGVVYVPVSGVTYFAAKGHGAFVQRADGATKPIKTRALGDDPIVAVASRSHRGPEVDDFLEKLGDYEVVSIGSSLKICLVAEGKADIYPRLGPTSEWDTAAAQAVLEEAGGKLTNLNLQPLPYNTKESILNPYFLAFGDSQHNWKKYL